MLYPEDSVSVYKMLSECSILFLWAHGSQESFTLKTSSGTKYEITQNSLNSLDFQRPEVAILNSCETGGTDTTLDINRNIAISLIRKGFLGVCAPFWIIDTETAVNGYFTISNKLLTGFPIASILRHTKYHKDLIFPHVYVYYGDPEYISDKYYPAEIKIIEKEIQAIIDESFTSSDGKVFRSSMTNTLDLKR
ncbi:MAG: hypothetical protein H7645_09320 [Candidatus Heimdallarchaeota archaeon]|nr:hypothetical protein [Candidatus Heimdallarchaeota archaeon]MCK4770527.1 hypothetical protein [Candidatus Heimdallarchaeota archaeon]